MDLSREEVYKNQKMSIGVTVLSFVVMLAFFIFTNVSSANPNSSKPSLSELSLSPSDNGGQDNPSPAEETSATAASQEKINSIPLSHEDEVILKNIAAGISDSYKASSQKESISSVSQTGTESETVPGPDGSTGNEQGNSIGEKGPLSFHLAQRSLVLKPSFTNKTQKEGTVVVNITVDASGTVIDADPNGRGTTTSDSNLKNEAKTMALATKFSTSQKQPEQQGTITIIFSFD